MEKQVDPLAGKATELSEYSTSDLSVEEQLAGGASVDDLISAGVLHDDYDPDNDPAYSFTPEPIVEEYTPGSPIPEEEFKAQMQEATKHSRMAAEHRKEANRRATWT